ncbi:hypothetical protein [Allorhodopirellula heiligendammensis]|uniref:hypothetical protein n=1 Tax=Allorhodopirellula heiligendammensis TaxID=2714739 RepID=UPI00265F86AA|nr:hypothetical protein [Allorhodopirellula heiligendammensis]
MNPTRHAVRAAIATRSETSRSAAVEGLGEGCIHDLTRIKHRINNNQPPTCLELLRTIPTHRRGRRSTGDSLRFGERSDMFADGLLTGFLE